MTKYCPTVFLTGITSLCTVALIAVERMFVICKPLGPMKFQKNHALTGIALSWLWSLTWNIPPLLGWGRYELEGVGTSCAPDWHNREPNNVSYIVTYFAVCFAVPFAIIIGSYSKLMWTLHQVRVREGREDKVFLRIVEDLSHFNSTDFISVLVVFIYV